MRLRFFATSQMRHAFGQLRLSGTPIQQLIRDGHCFIGKPRCTAAAIVAPFETSRRAQDG